MIPAPFGAFMVRWAGDGAMPQLMDTRSRAGTLAAAVNEILVTDGIPGLSLRRIAAVSRVSPGSMIHHLGGKDRLLQLSAALTARGLSDDTGRRSWDEGVLAFLPNGDEDVLNTRAWLAWVELGRSDPHVEPAVTRARDDERARLAESVDHRLARDELDLTYAVLEGLRARVCAPTRPMPPSRARDLLALHLRRLGVPITPAGAEP
jgi:AcrR family transcriptional regulator